MCNKQINCVRRIQKFPLVMSVNNVDLQVLKLIKPILQDDVETQPTIRKDSRDTADFALKYKTQKCRYWYTMGSCPFGQTCAFAHGDFQIRQKIHTSPNYKTKLCQNFSSTGVCRYGERCQFRHEIKGLLKRKTHPRHESYSRMLDSLADPLSSGANPRRLKFFERFELDTFDAVDWKYRKPRTYTI